MGYEPRRDLPIYIAALSPNMLRLAGEIGDGVMLWLCNPDYIRDVVIPSVSEGRERAGKTMDGFDVVAAVPVGLTDDPDEARARQRKELVPYASLPFYRTMLERSGFGDELAAFDEGMAAQDMDRAMSGLSDRLLEALAGIGSADDVRAAVERYRGAGVTSPCIGAIPGTDLTRRSTRSPTLSLARRALPAEAPHQPPVDPKARLRRVVVAEQPVVLLEVRGRRCCGREGRTSGSR